MRRTHQILASFSVALAVAASAWAQTPAPSSPGAAVPLARYIPKDNVLIYLEFQGTDAHADAWGKTAASKILTTTPTGAMIEDLLSQVINAQLDRTSPGTKGNRPDVAAIVKHIAKSGVVFAAHNKSGFPDGPPKTLVVRGALQPEVKAQTVQFIKSLTPNGGKSQTVDKPGNRKVAVISKADGKTEVVWWIENKQDLVLTDDPDAVIASLDGGGNVQDNAIHADLAKADGGFEPLGVAWADVSAFPGGNSAAATFFAKADIKGLKRVEYRIGTRGQALMGELRLVAPSPRSGNLAIFDQPKFDLKTVPPMPDGVLEFSAFSIDPAKLYGQVTAYAKTMNPNAEAAIQSAEATVKSKTRMRLREDILGKLGPKMVVYTSPKSAAKSGGLLGGLGGGGFQVPKGAMLVEMKDAKATTRMLDELMIFANKEIKAHAGAMGLGAPPAASDEPVPRRGTTKKSGAAAGTTPEFKVTLNNPKTYTLNLPTSLAAMTNARLTIAVGKKYVIIATMPDAAKEALTAEAKGATKALSADAAKAAEGLPAGLMALNVSDPRDTLPESLAKLPMTIQALMAPPAMTPPGAPPGSPPGAPPSAPGEGGRARPGRPGGAGGNGLKLSALGGGESPTPATPPGQPQGAPGQPQGAPGSPPAPITIQVDPAKIPKAEDIRPLLFPGASAVVVDDQGIRFISRYAFPDFATALDAAVQGKAVSGMWQAGGIPGMTPPPGAAPAGATGKAQPKGGGPAGSIAD